MQAPNPVVLTRTSLLAQSATAQKPETLLTTQLRHPRLSSHTAPSFSAQSLRSNSQMIVPVLPPSLLQKHGAHQIRTPRMELCAQPVHGMQPRAAASLSWSTFKLRCSPLNLASTQIITPKPPMLMGLPTFSSTLTKAVTLSARTLTLIKSDRRRNFRSLQRKTQPP